MRRLEEYEAFPRGRAPRVVYVDLDGTITRDGSLLHGSRGPSLAAARALVRLHEAGVEIVPASGRTVAQMREFSRAIGAGSFIAELGSAIGYDGGARIVPAAPTPRLATRRAIEETGAPEALMSQFEGVEPHEPWASRREHTVLLRGNLDVEEARALLVKEERFRGLTVIDNGEIGGGVHAYHVLPEGVDKAAAVAIHCRERGFAKEDCAAVGDSMGDLLFAREVGACFILGFDESVEAPENAFAVPERYGEGFERVVDTLLAA